MPTVRFPKKRLEHVRSHQAMGTFGGRTWKPLLIEPLSKDELEEVVEHALRVLLRIGLECHHEETIRRVTAAGDGVEHVNGRFRFSPSMVRAFLEETRKDISSRLDDPDPPFTLHGNWACLNYCDPDKLRVRPATTREAIQMARFWDARGINGVVPVIPGDVPASLVTLASERIALLHSRGLGGGLTVLNKEEIRFLIEMNLAAGRKYRLMEQISISPLRLNDEGLDAALAFLDNPDVEVSLAGPIPMAGVTVPLEPRAALVQSVAEVIGFEVIRHRLTGKRAISVPRIEPFDMQYALVVFGSPEWCLYRTLVFQVMHHLTGRPLRAGSFRSVAKLPDQQAACERTASVLWQALLGARSFGAVGQLSVDEVFSPQQAILDEEILRYVERVIRGLEIGPREADPLEIIEEGVTHGGFAALESTARHFRQFYWFPEIFKHWNVSRWQAEGAPSVLSVAWERARAKIAESDFRLPDAQAKEVERIYRKAARRLR